MNRPISAITSDIERFQPVDGEWLELDELMEELFASDSPSDGVTALLSVFERFPAEDGAGVFWVLPDHDSPAAQLRRWRRGWN